MEPNAIVTLVQTIGFPIVACGAMAWYVKYITDRNREDMEKIRESHSVEMKEVTKVLNANTIAINKLYEKLDSITGKG